MALLERTPDRLQNAVEFFVHLIIPKSDDSDCFFGEELFALLITYLPTTVIMPSAI